MENKSCKLAEITAKLKVFNINAFNCYLKEIWIDLISRIEKNENDIIIKNPHQNALGVTRLIFSKYYALPGIIGDRLFRVFDSKADDVLEFNEFKTGMNILFCEDYEKTLRFIFDFYDFDGDGKISKEDIRVVLTYVTYKNNDDIEQSEQSLNNKETERSVNYFNKKMNKITKKLYESSVQNQTQLTDILEKCFQNEGELINYKSFTNIIDKINSDIFFMIYIFLLKNRPFSFKLIQIYDNIIKYKHSCASDNLDNAINIYKSFGQTPNKRSNPYSYANNISS
jgi:Ca2+-binding EF-hand superfamily protein